jgi:GTP-binding nuclear protein Ran
MSTISRIKVLLVGDGAVGKTTFVKRHRTGEYDKRYNSTMGVEVHPLKFHTNKGPVIFNVWDAAGQEKFGGLRAGYYIQSEAAMVMFSHDSASTYNNVPRWISDVRKVCENIPVVVIGNKSDLHKKVTGQKVSKVKVDLPLYSVSGKTKHNYEKPFLHIARHFMGDDTQFVKV